MDGMNALDRQIASEVLLGAGPSEPVDDLAVFDAVIAASGSHRWGFWSTSRPSANGHTPTVKGRTYTMFSPVKAIIGGALVFAIGGVLLIAQPFDQQGSAPGATTDAGIGEVTSFEGVVAYRSNPDTGVLEALPNGVITNRGWLGTYAVVEMSDPRLEGTVSIMWNRDQILTGEVQNVWVGGLRIENPDGAWQMRPVVNFTLPDGTRTTVWTGIFDGEGDYEGLTAIAEVVEGPSRYTLRGIVIDGEVPPPPESMSAE